MHEKQAITKSYTLWAAIGVAVPYLILTGLYQLVSLPGKVAIPVFTLGQVALVAFGLSILFSIAMLFSRKHYRFFYLPLVINIFTFLFLYWAWFIIGPTQIRSINEDKSIFYSHTGIELPNNIDNVRELDNTQGSFFGDGDAELSFQINPTNLQEWMSRNRFLWKQGPFKKDGDTLNEFTDNETLIFKDSPEVKYIVIDRTPENLRQSPSDVSDSTTIFVNSTEGWVLLKDYDL